MYFNAQQHTWVFRKMEEWKWLVPATLPRYYFIANYWLLIISSVCSPTLLLCKFHESHSNRRYTHFYSARISFLCADLWVRVEHTIPTAASSSLDETALRPWVCVSAVSLLVRMSTTMELSFSHCALGKVILLQSWLFVERNGWYLSLKSEKMEREKTWNC